MGKKPTASAPSTPRATRSNNLSTLNTPGRQTHPTTGGLRKPSTKAVEKAKGLPKWVQFRAETSKLVRSKNPSWAASEIRKEVSRLWKLKKEADASTVDKTDSEEDAQDAEDVDDDNTQ